MDVYLKDLEFAAKTLIDSMFSFSKAIDMNKAIIASKQGNYRCTINNFDILMLLHRVI